MQVFYTIGRCIVKSYGFCYEKLAPPRGFEPLTPRSEAERSDPLSYGGVRCHYITKELNSHNYSTQNNVKINYMGNNRTKILTIVYVFFLFFSFFYVKNALSEGSIDVEQAKEDEQVDEVKPVKVTLVVEDKNTQKTYTKRLKNTDALLAFLETVREEDGLFYEINSYTNDTEIVDVDKTDVSEEYRWRIFMDGKDVTNEMQDINLEDDKVYYLKLIEK